MKKNARTEINTIALVERPVLNLSSSLKVFTYFTVS